MDASANKAEYLKPEEYTDLFGDDFTSAFAAARKAHTETWARLSAMAASKLDLPVGVTLKLTPGYGDTLGVKTVKAKAAKVPGSAAGAATRLASLGIGVKAAAEPAKLIKAKAKA